MKWIQFAGDAGQPILGVLKGDARGNRVLPLREAALALGRLTPSEEAVFATPLGFCDHSDAFRALSEKVLEAARTKDLPSHSEGDLKLLSPVPRPLSVRDGYAFRQHVESARKGRGLPMIPEFDHFPIFYFTNALSVTGPGTVEVHPAAMERLDFELEAAVVLGKAGRNIKAENADEHILGYMIFNDWSARALQTEEMKLNLGPAKGKDFASSFGPYLVSRDELSAKRIAGPKGERFDLEMRAWVGDKEVSSGNLRDMTWTFGEILERVSLGVDVYPGEVIGSGTVGTGCFMELNLTKVTDNWWLKDGDRVTMEIEGLGRLENRIKALP